MLYFFAFLQTNWYCDIFEISGVTFKFKVNSKVSSLLNRFWFYALSYTNSLVTDLNLYRGQPLFLNYCFSSILFTDPLKMRYRIALIMSERKVNPWKHQKTVRFSDVFKGLRKGALGTNGLNVFLCHTSLKEKYFSGRGLELAPKFIISFPIYAKIFRTKMSILNPDFPFMVVMAFEWSQ